MRNMRAGLVPARTVTKIGGAAAALWLAAAPLAFIGGQPRLAPPRASRSGRRLSGLTAARKSTDFYRARGGRPLWLAPQSGPPHSGCSALLNSAAVDGLDPDRYRSSRIAEDAARRPAAATSRASTAPRRCSARRSSITPATCAARPTSASSMSTASWLRRRHRRGSCSTRRRGAVARGLRRHHGAG